MERDALLRHQHFNSSYDLFLAPPIFVDVGNRFMMKLLQLPHMENIEIRCNASTAPHEYEPVVIQWMKNGKNIKKGNHNISYSC